MYINSFPVFSFGDRHGTSSQYQWEPQVTRNCKRMWRQQQERGRLESLRQADQKVKVCLVWYFEWECPPKSPYIWMFVHQGMALSERTGNIRRCVALLSQVWSCWRKDAIGGFKSLCHAQGPFLLADQLLLLMPHSEPWWQWTTPLKQ